jgi:hypothetical protein
MLQTFQLFNHFQIDLNSIIVFSKLHYKVGDYFQYLFN